MSTPSRKKVIDLFIYRISREGEFELLLLRRSQSKVYAGQWRMIGGKVEQGETCWQAALREMHEETGLSAKKFWSVPTVNHFYEPSTDTLHLIPVFAADTGLASEPKLDAEHSEYKWVSVTEADRLLEWPEQRRIVSVIEEIVMRRNILQEWFVE